MQFKLKNANINNNKMEIMNVLSSQRINPYQNISFSLNLILSYSIKANGQDLWGFNVPLDN